MKVLVIANNKGGVGKTTLSQFFAEYCARNDQHILVIDLDPQCNLSRRFLQMDIDSDTERFIPPLHPDYDNEKTLNPPWTGRSSSADIYLNMEAAIYPTNFANLDVIPGHHDDLLRVERVTVKDVAEKVHGILDRWLQTAGLNEYDLCIVDTSPSTGPLTTSAIRAASHLLIPAEMEQMSMEGLYGMTAIWTRENYRRPSEAQLQLVGILPNKYVKQLSVHHYFLEHLQKDERLGRYLLSQPMHLWQGYKIATMFRAPSIFDAKPKEKHRVEAEEICKLILERLNHA